jgi:hypothetical protein
MIFYDDIDKVILCQRFIRKKLDMLAMFDKSSQSISLKSKVINSRTLLDNSVDDIPNKYFYTVQENSQLYGFDLRELWEWIVINKKNTNPFTNNVLPTAVYKQIYRLYYRYNTDVKSDSSEQNQSYSAKLTSFFVRLESYGCYANLEGYKTLNESQLQDFTNILYNNNELIRKYVDENYIVIPNIDSPDYKSLLLDTFNYILDHSEDQTTIALLFVDRLSYYLFNSNHDNHSTYYATQNLDNIIDQIIQFNTFSIASTSGGTMYDSSTNSTDSDIYSIDDDDSSK